MSRAFIPAPNCASVEMIYSLNGVVAENVFHVRKASPFSGADLASLRGVFDLWDSQVWLRNRSSQAALTRIKSKALDSVGSPIEDYPLPTARGGSQGQGAQPGNVTYCVKLSTGLAGRSYRGRLYFVGLVVNLGGANANVLTQAWANQISGDLNTLITRLSNAGYTLGVMSWRSNKAWRTEGLFTPGVSWVAMDLNLDSQRRRLTGRGT